jgi:PPOX class probable F420-dependent enzyme
MVRLPRSTTVPEQLLDLVTTNIVGSLAYVRGDGLLAIVHVWIDWDGEHILASSPKGSYKGRVLRERPQVAVSAVDPRDPWRFLNVSGHVIDIHEDEGLTFINRLAQRYLGGPYPRTGEREVFVIAVDRIAASEGRSRR